MSVVRLPLSNFENFDDLVPLQAAIVPERIPDDNELDALCDTLMRAPHDRLGLPNVAAEGTARPTVQI